MAHKKEDVAHRTEDVDTEQKTAATGQKTEDTEIITKVRWKETEFRGHRT